MDRAVARDTFRASVGDEPREDSVGDRIGLPAKMLHDIVARAEQASAGKWRAVGRRIVAGEGALFDALVPRNGLPENARRNAEYVAAASPGAISQLVNELFRLRRAINDADRRVEEAEAEADRMRSEMKRARAVAAAVTLPTNAKAAATAARLADQIKQRAPEVGLLVDSLAAIARARAEVEGEE